MRVLNHLCNYVNIQIVNIDVILFTQVDKKLNAHLLFKQKLKQSSKRYNLRLLFLYWKRETKQSRFINILNI